LAKAEQQLAEANAQLKHCRMLRAETLSSTEWLNAIDRAEKAERELATATSALASAEAALNKISYEPIGQIDDSYQRVHDLIVDIARETLTAIRAQPSPSSTSNGGRG